MSLFDKWRQECRDREAEGYDERPYYTFLEEHIAELEAQAAIDKDFIEQHQRQVKELEAELKTIFNDRQDAAMECNRLRRENQRLREALYLLKSMTSGQCTLESLHSIAKAALDVAVKERNYERNENKKLREQIKQMNKRWDREMQARHDALEVGDD